MKKQTYFKLFVVLFIAFLSIMGKSCDDGPNGPTDPCRETCSDGLCVCLPDYKTNCANDLHLEPQVTTNADIVRVEWDFRDLPVRNIKYDSSRLYPTLEYVGYGHVSLLGCSDSIHTITLTIENSNGTIVTDEAVIEIVGWESDYNP